MTELDLGLKVGARKLLWSMGYSTRLDVELRGDRHSSSSPRPSTSMRKQASGGANVTRRHSPQGKGAGVQTFTDLDVLGVLVESDCRLSTTIVDCKSGTRDKSTARMFWARGVADLFGADHVMLVREHDVPDATRQLSNRLGVTVLPSLDLAAMQDLHGSPLADPEGALSVLFDRGPVEANLSAFNNLDRRLNSLLEYRDFDYWVYDHHRNPIQLVAHLRESSKHLDPRHPIHLALFLDLVWLYTVAVVRAVAHIRGAFLRDPDRGLQEYLFGGATNLREKSEVAALLRSMAPAGSGDLDHLPPYYEQLRELVLRFLRRPQETQTALRFAEAASALMAARRHVTLREAFGDAYRPLAAKLVADVCGFLVAATDLPPEFRTQARAWLLSEPVESGQRSSGGVAQPESGAGEYAAPADSSKRSPLPDTETHQ